MQAEILNLELEALTELHLSISLEEERKGVMHTSGVRGIDWQTLTVSYSPLLVTEPWALFR